MEHAQLCAIIRELARGGEERGEYEVSSVALTDDLQYVTFYRPQGYAMVRMSKADASNIGTFVQIAGGGAVGVPADATFCQGILERHAAIDWGGPFVRSWPNGLMTFATQMVTPGILYSDPDSFGFLLGMVDLFGEAARSIALELVPRFGGELLDGTGSNHEADLFAALVGPPPPGVDLPDFDP